MRSYLQTSAFRLLTITACWGAASADAHPTPSYPYVEPAEYCLYTSRKEAISDSLQQSSQISVQQLKPVHFVRDVMQPLGMPVVSTFHQLREHPFLNLHAKNATGLEAVGDFFLAPSRYLFAGKTVKLDQEGERSFEIEQSFHYHRMHWLKTTVFLTVLPVTSCLGATLKGISYLFPKVRRKQRMIRAGLKAALVQSHSEEYRDAGIGQFHSESYIPCLHYKRPSILSKKQRAEIRALKDVVEILDQHGIVHWIDFGTCLGAYRYGGIIPWDWDIDLSILLPDHDNVKRVLSQLDPKKYQIQDWSSYSNPKTFLKLYVKETKNFIDITHYQIDPEKKETSYFFTYLNSPFPDSWKKDELKGLKPVKFETLFPLKRANFDGVLVWAPNDVETYLKSKYNNNLEPSNVWDEEAQCYRKVENHPYWLQ
jgi:phosphorylcholine metabolism protein LicD